VRLGSWNESVKIEADSGGTFYRFRIGLDYWSLSLEKFIKFKKNNLYHGYI
jgi:hypothetical protein